MSMTDKPERIWIDSKGIYPYFYPKEPSNSAFPVTEYIRADLCHPTPTRCVELETVAYYRVNRTHLTHIPHKGYDELVTRQNAEEVIKNLKNEVAVKDKLIQSLIDFDSEEVKRLEADNKRLREALERITDWPNGGKNYGQENIKGFARAALGEVKT